MDERRRGERVTRSGGELAPRHTAELLVDQWKDLIERAAASGAQICQELGDAHCGMSWRYGVAKRANRMKSRGHF
jgi:hypothetical protein